MSSKIYKPKLKSGKETKTYFVNYHFNGRRYQRALGETRYETALTAKNEVDRLLVEGTNPDILFGKVETTGKKIILSDFEKRFINLHEGQVRTKEQKGFSPDTIEAYKKNFKILKSIFESKFGQNITLKDITRPLVEMEVIPYLRKNYADATIIH